MAIRYKYFEPANLRLITNIVGIAALFFTTLAVFVPFSPGMPAAGLDPSWRFGLNQAIGQGLAFGRDIIFTFGPHASIFAKETDAARTPAR